MAFELFRPDWYERLEAMPAEPRTRFQVNMLIALAVANVIDRAEFRARIVRLGRAHPDWVKDQVERWQKRNQRKMSA